MISVAAELAEMHPQTLRMYEARGLITPKRSPKNTRLYSQADVERLRRIQQMTNEEGLNLAGVETVLELERRLERMRGRHGEDEKARRGDGEPDEQGARAAAQVNGRGAGALRGIRAAEHAAGPGIHADPDPAAGQLGRRPAPAIRRRLRDQPSERSARLAASWRSPRRKPRTARGCCRRRAPDRVPRR